jgi:hypothetical protein
MSGVRGQKPAGNDPGVSDRPAPADAAAWAMASGACGLTRDQRSGVRGQKPAGNDPGVSDRPTPRLGRRRGRAG